MSLAIETRELEWRAGKSFALQQLSLHVPAGAIYGFLGPNGSGKTTTIRLLLGLLRPSAGGIRLLGHDIPGALHLALLRTGYVPERPQLYPSLTVAESVRYHAAFYPSWDATWAADLQRRFGLEADRVVGRLSKGEMGKLMILLALAQSPELLVLDEPTDGLDPVVRREVLTALLDYVAARQATVFISSHLVHEQERICDWVGVLDDGRMVAELPMSEFRAGIKRLRVRGAASALPALPFRVLARRTVLGNDEEWVVRDWRQDMRGAVEALVTGATLREVEDLDLEDSFVELLSAARDSAPSGNDGQEAA